MKKLHYKRLPAAYKRVIVATCAILVILLLAYAEVLRPNQDAKAYVSHLDASSKPLQQCFEKLSDTTQLKLYYAPDIALKQKHQDTAAILKQIDVCRADLKDFNAESHDLINLHVSGYTPSYRQAKVYQRQAFDIVGQSNDVLEQYSKLASFLSNYYDQINAYETYTQELESNKYYIGDAQLTTMQQQAADLRHRATQIRELEAPAEFATTKTETAAMFNTAATGLETIVKGYRNNNSTTIELGYQSITKANANYDSRVINLPFEQLIKSYIPKQVNQLPAKVENLLSSSSE